MANQAKTLNKQELRRVLDHIATRKHAARNRAMLLLTHYAGMRVGEVAALRCKDVVDATGHVKTELRLDASQTKGKQGRTVFISDRLRKELQSYADTLKCIPTGAKFFYTQKTWLEGFTANTLTQHFFWLYKRAGIEGASSHSGRRTFATTLSAKGVAPRVLMRAMGHKSLSSTMVYIDASDEMIRNAVELAM
jgi:integrase/recombinase XerD